MKKMVSIFIAVLVVSGLVFLLNPHKEFLTKVKEGKMRLNSVFEHNGNIPSEYTCDGEDKAPVLNISDIPEGTKELVLIVDDPDAPVGTWVHWVLYNIPKDTAKIDNNNLPEGVKQGMTDFGRVGWGGPCPPSGVHRYFFKLYAIDKTLDLPSGSTKYQVEKEIRDSIIEKAELMGHYERGMVSIKT